MTTKLASFRAVACCCLLFAICSIVQVEGVALKSVPTSKSKLSNKFKSVVAGVSGWSKDRLFRVIDRSDPTAFDSTNFCATLISGRRAAAPATADERQSNGAAADEVAMTLRQRMLRELAVVTCKSVTDVAVLHYNMLLDSNRRYICFKRINDEWSRVNPYDVNP